MRRVARKLMGVELPRIEHVVVVMLENRSFDCMLGRLYPKSDRFDGLDGTETNPWHRPDGTVEEVGVWNSTTLRPQSACLPQSDPGELFADINMQLFGLGGMANGRPSMTGFVDNFMRQPPSPGLADRPEGAPTDPRAVMHYFTPAQVPVISRLATAFAVSDRWHASGPCETWPNRYFARAGTGGGHVNNERAHFPHRRPRLLPTIFRRLGKCGYSWKIYFHDLPQAATLVDLWLKIPTHFCLFETFEDDARAGKLPNYSFIEPRYFPSRWSKNVPNDQHPPHNILYGEQLIAAVYNAVRNAPTWGRTLLVVTYDEHGGCFDHVPPPAAVPPGGPYTDGFEFDRYGVRVPAVLISPFVAPGSIVRPPQNPAGGPTYPFDHSSIIATLQGLFELGPPMTPRVAAAPDLLCALTLEAPENQGPAYVSTHPRRPSRAEARAHARLPRNGLQRSMQSPLSGLPGTAARAIAHARRLRPRRKS
jgi:phospholipase C